MRVSRRCYLDVPRVTIERLEPDAVEVVTEEVRRRRHHRRRRQHHHRRRQHHGRHRGHGALTRLTVGLAITRVRSPIGAATPRATPRATYGATHVGTYFAMHGGTQREQLLAERRRRHVVRHGRHVGGGRVGYVEHGDRAWFGLGFGLGLGLGLGFGFGFGFGLGLGLGFGLR